MDNYLGNSPQNIFPLSKDALLKLYDKKRKKEQTAEDEETEDLGSPITAITSLIGEDLLLGLFDHYLESRDADDGVLWDLESMYKCKSPGRSGPRLDAWVETKKGRLYQAEAKNWCASAIGGVEVDDEGEPEASEAKSRRRRYTWPQAAEHNRKRYLTHKDTIKPVWKVLAKTELPDRLCKKNTEPLLLFWSPFAPFEGAPKDELAPFFSIKTTEFEDAIRRTELKLPDPIAKEVYIFSASNYLRQKGTPSHLKICMPRVSERLNELEKLGFPIDT